MHANRGALNTLGFDGHVELLGDRASRDIDHWYPSGALAQQPSEGMTTLPIGYEVP